MHLLIKELTSQSLHGMVRARESEVSRLHRRNHNVIELLPESQEVEVVIQIPSFERELDASLCRISIRVTRVAVHLVQST